MTAELEQTGAGARDAASVAAPTSVRARGTTLSPGFRRGGLSRLAVPAAAASDLRCLLVVPDRQAGADLASAHERDDHDLGRVPELQRGVARPALPDRRQEHARVRRPGADLRLPDPAGSRGADERGAQAARAVRRARLPAGCDPTGGGGAALEDLLRRRARAVSSTRSSAGSASRHSSGSSRRPRRCRRSCSSRPGRTRAPR